MIRTQKWVFDGQTRPYEIWNLKTNLVSFVRGKKKEPVERERGEEEEEKKRKRSQDQGQKGMELRFLVWKLL